MIRYKDIGWTQYYETGILRFNPVMIRYKKAEREIELPRKKVSIP